MTIPRLELQATVLLAELLAKMKITLQSKDIPSYCWTDSSIVLHWIKTCPSRLEKYVANRVWKINEEIPNQDWRYVPTNDNPADVASRGLSPCDLEPHHLWWTGPSWLIENEEVWPIFPMSQSEQNLSGQEI